MRIKKARLVFISFSLALILIACCNKTIFSDIIPDFICDKSVTFFITTDIHYLCKSLTDGEEAFQKYVMSGDGKQLHYIDEIMDAFVNDVEEKKPDVLIISGDLTNNGERESHLSIARKLKKIEESGISVYVIPGNHDIQNPCARRFEADKQHKVETITDKDFSEIYADFGYDEAISRDKTTLSYLAAPSKNIWLLMLDTNKYKNNLACTNPRADGRICKKTLAWIKNCSDFAKEKGAKIIPVMHHSLLDHNEVVKDCFTLNNSIQAIEMFKNSEVDLVLTGHIHIQDIKFDNNDSKSIYDIATSSLAVYPHQYGVLKYSPNAGYDYSTSQVNVESWAKEHGIEDKNINNFKEYSKDFFEAQSYDRFYDTLLQLGRYTDEEMRLISKTMTMLNAKYYEGIEHENIEEIKKTKGFKLLAASPPNFLRDYAMSILNRENTDNKQLHIPAR